MLKILVILISNLGIKWFNTKFDWQIVKVAV